MPPSINNVSGCVAGAPCTDNNTCINGTCGGGTPIDCGEVALACEGLGTPNTGETEINGSTQTDLTLCLPPEGSEVLNEVTFDVTHRIVTHDTERSRDLHGLLKLFYVSGDAAAVDLLWGGNPYTLGSPIPVIETGHGGCGDHTWHDRIETFTAVPLQPGVVTLRAQVDPELECCEGDGVPTVEAEITITVVSVNPTVVNSQIPSATTVGYHVDPHDIIVDSATFTAPGTTLAATGLPGNFSFTFDQGALVNGTNTIRLESTIGTAVCTTDVVATRTMAKAPPRDVTLEVASFKVPVEGGIATVFVTHEISGRFAFICYSEIVVPGSKTLWVGTAFVNIKTEQSTEIPTQIAAWAEKHLYRTQNGDYLEQFMLPVTVPTIPAQSLYFRSVELSVSAFFAPNENLTSIATIDSLWFIGPNGLIQAFPVPILGNPEIDLVLEPNADPVVECP